MNAPHATCVLGVTLARGRSKSVLKKNIRPILGAPLIAYTIAEAKRSRFLTRYLVSTDDAEIQEVAREYGAEAPFLRPPPNSPATHPPQSRRFSTPWLGRRRTRVFATTTSSN